MERERGTDPAAMTKEHLNLAECVRHGFWFCEGCGKVVQVEVDEVFRICPQCGARRVRFVAGIGTNAECKMQNAECGVPNEEWSELKWGRETTSNRVPRGTSFHVERRKL